MQFLATEVARLAYVCPRHQEVAERVLSRLYKPTLGHLAGIQELVDASLDIDHSFCVEEAQQLRQLATGQLAA